MKQIAAIGRSELLLSVSEGMSPAMFFLELVGRSTSLYAAEAEQLARAILDELGLDHSARSLDLDAFLTRHDGPTHDGSLVVRPILAPELLREVIRTATSLYTSRLLMELGERPANDRNQKPPPDQVLLALYTPQEIAAMREPPDSTLWELCVDDAFQLVELVRVQALRRV